MSIKDASGKIIIRTIGACIVLFFNNCLSLNYSSINKKKGAKNIANRYITGS